MATYIIFSHLLPGSYCEPKDFIKGLGQIVLSSQ